jgi:U3 small nucleolar ribonucleoprotein protein IMP4
MIKERGEYSRILITTSHRPSRRVRSFINDLKLAIPNTVKVNRGKMGLHDVMTTALENRCDRIIIVSRWKGNPGKMCFYKLSSSNTYIQVDPIIYISSVKLTREIKDRIYFRPKEIIIDINSSNKALIDFGNMLSKALNIKERSQTNLYTKVRIEESQKFFCTILFVKNNTNTLCGPIINVKHACRLKN